MKKIFAPLNAGKSEIQKEKSHNKLSSVFSITSRISLFIFVLILQINPAFSQRSKYFIENAQKEVEMIRTELELDAKQIPEVEKIMKQFLQQIESTSEQIDKNWQLSKQDYLAIETLKENQLYEILSEEQWIIYNVLKNKIYAKRPRKKAENI